MTDKNGYIKKLGPNWTVDFVTANDGTNLRFGLYQQPNQKLNRCVVYINGRTEWIEKNLELPESLNLPVDCGFLTWDLRGQGQSGGTKSWVDSFSTYASDAKCIIEHCLGRAMPYSLLSHSTGGLIAVYGILNGFLSPLANVCCSPLLGFREVPIPSILAKPIASVLSHIGLSKASTGAGSLERPAFEENVLTHDHHMYQVICHSPYPIPSATFGWVHACHKAMSNVQNMSHLSAPTLVLIGSEEKVVSVEAARKWSDLARKSAKVDVQFLGISGARHELLSEIDPYRSTAISETRSWFKDFFS